MSRILGLFRHAEYNPHTGDVTREGERQLEYVIEALREAEMVPDSLYHSTVKRAVQSAQFAHARMVALWGKAPQLVACEAFNENASYSLAGMKAMLAAIQGFPDPHHKIFVMTHQPEIMRLGKMINARFSSPDKAQLLTFDFGKTTWSEMQIVENMAGDVTLSAYPVAHGILSIVPPLPKAVGKRASVTRLG